MASGRRGVTEAASVRRNRGGEDKEERDKVERRREDARVVRWRTGGGE
jgi:hypothetical protein